MAVVSEEALLAVVDRVYESVEQPELWPTAIHAVGELIGGRRHFWCVDESTQGCGVNLTRTEHILGSGCHGTFFLSRADLQILDEYEDQFGELITCFLKIVFLSVLSSYNNVAGREAIGLRMAQRYLQAFESQEESSASSQLRSARRKLIAAFWEDGRIFSRDNLRFMRLLVPHLDRALRLQMRLDLADVRADLISGALDCLTLGVVLIDSSGLPIQLNKRAREIVSQSNGLRFSASGLTGQSPSDTRSLRELIKGAVSARRHGLLTIKRGLDLRPLLLIAFPLKSTGTNDASDPSGVIFISDPDRNDSPSVESLRRAFNLTHREAQMAIAIAQGHGLQAAADEMGVAVTTARTQLQQAFAKTETNHQAELAALVHRTLTHVRHD